MSKKSIFYVILSGLITAGAFLGWNTVCDKNGVDTQNAEPQTVVVQAGNEIIEQGEVKAEAEIQTGEQTVHEAFLKALASDDDVLASAVKSVSETAMKQDETVPAEKTIIRLATPNTPPQLGALPVKKSNNSAGILDKLTQNETLKDAKTLALVDLKNIEVIAATDDVQAYELIALLPSNSNKAGQVMHIRDNALEKLIYQCIGDDCQYALLASFAASVNLNEEVRCQAADSEFVSCGENVADNAELLNGCTPSAARKAILDVLKTQEADNGVIEVDGKKYQFAKTSVNGCEIATVVEANADTKPAAAPVAEEKAPVAAEKAPVAAEKAPVAAEKAPVAAEKAPVAEKTVVSEDHKCRCHFTPIAIAKASAAGIVMILLGIVCIRRREEKIVEKKPALDQEKEGMKAECRKLTAERDDAVREKAELNNFISKLKQEAVEANEKTRKLNEELESAKSTVKLEQLQRMSLEDEKQRLEDALAVARQDRTNVASPSIFAQNASSSNLPLIGSDNSKKTQDLQKVDTNRVTSQAPSVGVDQSQAFFDALTDEGWDEIEDSFDAIFSPSKTGLAPIEPPIPLDNTKSASDDINEGIGDIFSGLKNADRRVADKNEDSSSKHITTETSLKPIIDSKQNQLPTLKARNVNNVGALPTVGKGNAAGNVKGMTLNGLSTIKSSLPEKVTESASELAIRKSSDASDSFKPSPSWTGKSVIQDKGMDENSLLSALKRRAKDVSEIKDAPQKEAAKPSGALGYNRGLSKSGVFSVTGSRVDIDPLSDIEYFKSLYEKYVAIQKKCGEATDKFTMEQFVSRLSREKAELMRKYKCSNVLFTVTEKNGKASLKASPKA